jgi:hypothetical protein
VIRTPVTAGAARRKIEGKGIRHRMRTLDLLRAAGLN